MAKMFLQLYFLVVHVIQKKMVWTNKAAVANETQEIKKRKALPIRTVRSQATSKTSTICAKVGLEREAGVEHLVLNMQPS